MVWQGVSADAALGEGQPQCCICQDEPPFSSPLLPPRRRHFPRSLLPIASAEPRGYEAEDFLCREQGRILTDEEFLKIAFAYEAQKHGLPESFHSLGIPGLRERNPNCCTVLREDNPLIRNWGWLERFLFDLWAIVGIAYTLENTNAGSVSYHISICGEMRERNGSFYHNPPGQ